MKKTILSLLLVGLFSVFCFAKQSHSSCNGGHYVGGSSQSHKGSHYVNAKTNNKYRSHKR